MEPNEQNTDRPCQHCGAATWEAVVNAAVWTEGGLVAVEGIPARVCEACGEQFFDETIAGRIAQAARDPAAAPARELLVPVFSLIDVELPRSQIRPEALEIEDSEAAELTFAGIEQGPDKPQAQEAQEDPRGRESWPCKYCGADTYRDLVKSAFWGDSGLVAVEDVPARVCRQCGERFYDDRTAWKIEKVMNDPAVKPRQKLVVPLWSLAEIDPK